jgi:outer membrane protein
MRIPAAAWAVAGLLATLPLQAQQTVPASLSLDEALEIARSNNPVYLQAVNDRDLADWDVRQAYGQLLPSASANSSVTWQGSGEQQFGTLTLGDLGFGNLPSYYLSSYGLSLSYNLNWATLKGMSSAKAQRAATVAETRVSESTLVSQVTFAYLEVLRQQEAVRLSEQQLENSSFNLRLAQGRLEVGAATPIDVGQAEVQVGRSEVAVLQSENALATARMRLMQQLGVPVDQSAVLATEFVIEEPGWELEDLYSQALGLNPGLEASTGWSGFSREASNTDLQLAQAQAGVAGQVSQCNATNELFSRLADPLPLQDCGVFAFTDAQRQAIVDQNNQFPFNFQSSPLSVRATISVPIFQGLSRQRGLEAAKIQRDDLEQQVREQELALRADLSIALANVRTAYQSALLEERNRDLADQQLRLARERYQLGAITFVELVDAQTVLVQADRDRTAAVFAYHDSVSTLEVLVGTTLR